jgi:DNA-binding beta-propeller fold protein YncE
MIRPRRFAPFLAAAVLGLLAGPSPAEQFTTTRLPAVIDSFGVAVSADNRTVYAVSGYGHVSVIDAVADSWRDSIDLSSIAAHPTGVAFHHGKLYVVSVNRVVVVDADSLAVTRVLPLPYVLGSSAGDAAVSPDGSRVYAAGGSSYALCAIDPVRDEITATVEVGRDHTALAISPDGTRAYLVNPLAGLVTMVDLESMQVAGTADFLGGRPFLNLEIEPAVRSDGRLYLAWVDSRYRGRISILDPDGALLDVFTLPGYSTGIAFSLDERLLLTGGGYVVDSSQGTVIADLSLGSGLSRVAFAPSGERAYVTDTNLQYVIAVEGFRPSLTMTGSPRASATIRLNLLAAGQDERLYQIAASCSVSHGTRLPDGRRFPLDRDALFRHSVRGSSTAFSAFAGHLDAGGQGTASVRLSAVPGKSVGQTFHLAFATFRSHRPTPATLAYISNVLSITILP